MPDDSREQLQFDVERYVRLSKKVDISDLDLSQAGRYPISDEEIRALTYMTDIESHTIVYLRAILNTCAVEDPQTTAFLSCWAYEEFFHGHTLRQFLNAVGVPISATRIAEVQKATSFLEWLKELGSSILCRFSTHFHAAYLTYGAISELSTLEGYGVLARKTQNPVLGGNCPAAGQGRTPALRVLLQQSSPATAVTQCATADQFHHSPLLASGGWRSEAGQRSGLDSFIHPGRSPGRRHCPPD